MHAMDVELLRTFLAAARLGSMRRAADELFLAPPTVIVHIRRLAGAAGCRLFERGGRGVRLTPAGWWLLPRAEAALAEVDAAREGLLAFRQGAGQRIALAVSPFVARTALPYALGQLRAERPELDYAVDVVQSVDIAVAVAQGGPIWGCRCCRPRGAGRWPPSGCGRSRWCWWRRRRGRTPTRGRLAGGGAWTPAADGEPPGVLGGLAGDAAAHGGAGSDDAGDGYGHHAAVHR